MNKGYVAFDFDKTIAVRNSGDSIFKAGAPIRAMVDLMKKYLSEGRKVKVLTARKGELQQRPVVKFLKDNGFPPLEVINCKDSNLDILYDDKCIQVELNTGELTIDKYKKALNSLLGLLFIQKTNIAPDPITWNNIIKEAEKLI